MKILHCFSCIFLLLMPVCIQAKIRQPELRIPFTKTAPLVDGKLNDAAWQSSAEIADFVNWSLDSYSKDAVIVYLCYDEKNLYIAFRNTDSAAGELNKVVDPNRPRDTFLWGRNHARIGIGYKNSSLQLIADPKETMADWKNNDINWNGNWKYAASINTNNWTAEFSIPLSEFDLTKSPENERVNIGLSRSFPAGESSDWSGVSTLSGPAKVSGQYGRWPEPVPGKNKLEFKAKNFSTEKQNLQCELEIIPLNEKPEFINQAGQGPSSDFQLKISSQPLVFKTNYSVPAGGTVDENIPFELPVEGSYYATATVKAEDGTVLRRSVDYWFTIEPNRQKIKIMKEWIGESIAALTRVSNPVADGLKTESNQILTRIQAFESGADSAWNSGKWNEFTAEIENEELKIAQFTHKVRWAALNYWEVETDFGIAFAHSILKLRKDALFPLPISKQFDFSLARNEYESLQLVVLPFGRDLKDLSIETSDLSNANGNVILKKNIEISLVGYNKIDWQAQYVASYKGWHPDPLIPVKAKINISGDDVCRPIWITVYAPSGTKAGEYSGTVTLSASGMKKITAVIKCRVWDFDLPLESHLKTHSWDEINNLSDFYNQKELPLDWYLRFCELLLKNRFNPGSAGVNYMSQTPNSAGEYDFSKVEKVLSFCIDRGLSRFSIMQMKKGLYTPEEEEQAYKFATAYAKFLRQKGWLDKALIELWDEPTDLEWPYIKERAERLKKIDPGLRLQLFAEGGPYNFWEKETDKYGLNKLIDMWAPINCVESPETQANGGEIWAYFATLARESAPNFYIDCPAIYQRSIAWYSWMYGLDCFEHWGSNYFWRNVQKGKPMDQKWPNVPWDSRTYFHFNGEGQLIYPGPDGMPYSSIRLENFRDGMEDYEYLFRLKELISKHENDIQDSELNEYRQLLNPESYLLYKYPRKIKVTLENTLRYPEQPERILEMRQKIAEAIEQLQKGPASSEYRFETVTGSDEGFANGKAEESLFRTPEGITVDSKGNIFTTEYWTAVVRKITPDGTVSVLAGKGNESGNMNGTGSEARFNKPHGLVVVGDSVIYVCDMKSQTIRKVTYNGVVTTFAGIMGQAGAADGFRTVATFNQPEAIAVNSKGELFVADSYNFTIRKIAINGEVSTFAGFAGKAGYADGEGFQALFNKPLGIAIDGKDNIYVADSDYDGTGGNCVIRKITPDGKVSTVAGIPLKPGHADGNAKNSQFDRPVGIAATTDGTLFIADTEADLIRKIDTNGKVSTIGGKYLDETFADGTGSNARFADPQAITVDRDGNLYITDTFNNRIRKGVKISKE